MRCAWGSSVSAASGCAVMPCPIPFRSCTPGPSSHFSVPVNTTEYADLPFPSVAFCTMTVLFSTCAPSGPAPETMFLASLSAAAVPAIVVGTAPACRTPAGSGRSGMPVMWWRAAFAGVTPVNTSRRASRNARGASAGRRAAGTPRSKASAGVNRRPLRYGVYHAMPAREAGSTAAAVGASMASSIPGSSPAASRNGSPAPPVVFSDLPYAVSSPTASARACWPSVKGLGADDAAPPVLPSGSATTAPGPGTSAPAPGTSAPAPGAVWDPEALRPGTTGY